MKMFGFKSESLEKLAKGVTQLASKSRNINSESLGKLAKGVTQLASKSCNINSEALGKLAKGVTQLASNSRDWIVSQVETCIASVQKGGTLRKWWESLEGTKDELPEEEGPFVDGKEMFIDGKVDLTKVVPYLAQSRKRYDIKPERWKAARDGLVLIKRRQTDQTLYLGVIGEASAGKSTFVNAVLGFEFLKEDTCLGTTAAATILRYGDVPKVVVVYIDGRVEELNAQKIGVIDSNGDDWSARLLETVHKYTADEDISRNVRCVEVYLPIENDLLKSGVAIVDTPGINSENPRHNDVTTRAIKDVCDAALILVPANVPLSACLSSYVKENLLDVLGRCVLVVTQIDKLRERERTHQLKYIRSRLKSAVGGDVSCGYQSAAYYVLKRDDYGKASEAEVVKYRTEFAEMLESLKSVVGKCKTAAILEKMLVFLKNSLVPLLRELISSKKHEVDERKELLKKNRLVNLDSFLEGEQKIALSPFGEVVITEDSIIEEVTKVRSDFENEMYNLIYGAENRGDLKKVLEENAIHERFDNLQVPFKKSMYQLCQPYREIVSSAMESFHRKFSEAYQTLQGISRKESLMSISKVADKDMSVELSFGDTGEALGAQLSADKMKSMGGAGAGAVIGSFICPGLGTVIGGVVGGVFGAIFRKSLDVLKGESYSSICSLANEWSTQMIPQAYTYIDNHKKICQERLTVNIASYKKTYGRKIEKIIEDEKREQENLVALAQHAELDVELLQSLQEKAEIMINESRTEESEADSFRDFEGKDL